MSLSDEKMLFAFQFWNNEFDWYTPNGHPEDWMINGKKTIPYSHQEFYFEKNSEDIKLKGRQGDFLLNSKQIETKLLSNIPVNQKYILPIFIHRIDYFENNRLIGFKYLLPRVIDDVKNNLAKIVLFFPYEGNTSIRCKKTYGDQITDGMLILDQWCKEFNFTKNQVYFIQANLLATQFNDRVSYYTSIGIDTFIDWIPENFVKKKVKSLKFNPTDEKHLFLSYNRNLRTHRKLLLLKLLQYDLFDKGLISCGENLHYGNTIRDLDAYNSLDLAPYLQDLSKITPLTIDINLEKDNPAVQLTFEHYEKTFISVIAETHFESDILFRSEKIFKPLAIGHPFIVLSSPGFLKSLKDLGFRTFDKWIDESYDREENLLTRITKIIKELKKFSNMNKDELIKIRKEMETNTLFNIAYFHFLSMAEKKPHDTTAIRTIRKIWKELTQ